MNDLQSYCPGLFIDFPYLNQEASHLHKSTLIKLDGMDYFDESSRLGTFVSKVILAVKLKYFCVFVGN